MATFTPPPYFPQSALSPAENEAAMRKRRMTFYGCIGLLIAGFIGGLVGLIFLIKWLL